MNTIDISNMKAKEMLGYFQNKLDEEAREAKKWKISLLVSLCSSI